MCLFVGEIIECVLFVNEDVEVMVVLVGYLVVVEKRFVVVKLESGRSIYMRWTMRIVVHFVGVGMNWVVRLWWLRYVLVSALLEEVGMVVVMKCTRNRMR